MIDLLPIFVLCFVFTAFTKYCFFPKKKKLNVTQLKQMIEDATIDLE